MTTTTTAAFSRAVCLFCVLEGGGFIARSGVCDTRRRGGRLIFIFMPLVFLRHAVRLSALFPSDKTAIHHCAHGGERCSSLSLGLFFFAEICPFTLLQGRGTHNTVILRPWVCAQAFHIAVDFKLSVVSMNRWNEGGIRGGGTI